MSDLGYLFICALPSFHSKFVVDRLPASSRYVFGRADIVQGILACVSAVDDR